MKLKNKSNDSKLYKCLYRHHIGSFFSFKIRTFRPMEATKIICSGKIRFISPDHAVEVQTELLSRGYRFAHGVQAPRHTAYGCMWRNGEIRCAGNVHAFRGYGVPVSELWQEKPVQKIPKEQKQEIARKAAEVYKAVCKRRVTDMAAVVIQAMREIGQYEPNLYGTNSRSQARLRAWDELLRKCVDITKGNLYANSLRSAIRQVLDGAGKPYMLPEFRRFYRIIREAR